MRIQRNLPIIVFIVIVVISMILVSLVTPTKAMYDDTIFSKKLSNLPIQSFESVVPSTRIAADGGDLIYVPGGEFIMGSKFKDPLAFEDEHPLHTVYLDSFWIHKTEITNTMYSECVLEGPCYGPDTEETGPFTYPHYNDPAFANHPVVGVTWYQAATYCEWIGGRLPTEAEWEKTARGSEAPAYPWGLDQPICDLSNFEDCVGETEEIGSHVPGQSPVEALDMAGNVREWVWDFYVDTYYGVSPSYNPPGPSEGVYRVVRGGGFKDDSQGIRSAIRYPFMPEASEEDIGFRCVILEPAPYCPLSYNPTTPPSPRSCGSENLDPERILLEFGCEGTSVRNLNLNLRHNVTGNESVSVDEYDYNCETNPNYTDRLFCSGPSARQGQTAEITICNEGGYTPDCSFETTYSAGIQSCIPETENDDSEGGCATGYSLGLDQETCDVTPGGGGNDDCLEGYAYDGGQETCIDTRGDECAQGFYFNYEEEQCLPTTFLSNTCGQGFYFNTEIQCCTPYSNNMGCPENSSFNSELGYCIPQSGDGDECPEGYSYDTGFAECRSNGGENTQCPSEYSFNTGTNGCQPINDCPEPSGGGQSCVLLTSRVQTCVQPTIPSCPRGHDWDSSLQECVLSDCGKGHFWDTGQQICVKGEDPNAPPGCGSYGISGCGSGNNCYWDTGTNTCQGTP